MRDWLAKLVHQNKGILVFLVLMVVFRSSFADWNEVPTGSMKPTIVEGDRILINKLAYDIRIPFTRSSILKLGDPERGDIVVFDSAVSDKRLVKRIIGLPGDTIEMHDNILRINQQTLHYTITDNGKFGIDKVEDLFGLKHQIRTNQRGSLRSTFAPIHIPNDMYLALGDNRDNSADSRVIGFVPRHEIIGRTQRVVMSLNYDKAYKPRRERFFKAI